MNVLELPKVKTKKPIDYTSLWSRLADREHKYNRLDPDSDRESVGDTSEASRAITNDGKIKIVLTREDWKTFWVQRLRKLANAPNLSDKDIFDIVERNRRIYFQNKKENTQFQMDKDLPQCYYWDKFQVAEWAITTGLPVSVKDLLLSSGISGRELITLDANTLLKLGVYNLTTIKMVTKAVREILGLPQPNGMRAISRFVPLENFLKVKLRSGPKIDKMTFKDFCEIEGIEYEPAKKQKEEGYKQLPERCKVIIKPYKYEKVKWIPVKRTIPKKQTNIIGEDPTTDFISDASESSSSDSSFLDSAPTVEQLANNLLVRNTVIPQILNDIVEAVFAKLSEDRMNTQANDLAEREVKARLEVAYSDLSIVNPEDKLKLVTIIAEELVEDVLRAREILEDIDKFQTRIQREMSESEMNTLQNAVAHYVQSIMPLVVAAALKEMEGASFNLVSKMKHKNSVQNHELISRPKHGEFLMKIR